ncbi:PREDICTED: TMV resistance protein N-like isoform X1 [Prunus mume]|uniref:ADP-ribosyl cyclase/cyclic ADP-ribose hydrolase n=1 Tax=Prunus mume TaxID=102107 RepID=A0ABM1LSI4_PRUMU|nr:PREDICTED: TMV resistance protein N-like isoform X1 [Prunus mume]
MSSSSLAASSSVALDLPWKYDVFLSFRGEDTRYNFTAYLHERLLEQGITKIFLDEKDLEIGRPVAELFAAIEQSRLAIVVMSPKYASSKWCMNELLKILECMEKRGAVLPIFHSVEPSDVGKQSGNFGEAFTELEQRCKDEKEMVERWRAALRIAAKIKGWTSKNRYEPHLIKEIVEKVRIEVGPISLEPAEKLVGIDSKLKELDLLLDPESNDVHFIGIWGMSGIGKTTIARKAYERIVHKFEVKSFRERVREVSKAHGLDDLQRKLSNNLMHRNIEDWNSDEEARMRHFFRGRKVLLILDDVDDKSQLKKLCGSPTWFGQGSRIIITTTNEHLLISHGVERRYEVQGLNDNDALKLFSLRAFKTDYPLASHMDLSKRYVNYANGHPLALEVWGSLVHERGEDALSSQLHKMEDDLNREIMNPLNVGYEGLDKQEKDIFLDISCFFKGKYKDRVVEILESCGFHPGIDIDVLVKRSLITISHNMVWMHDLLQELGRAIIRQKSQEPGEHSRLWLSGDIFHVLSKNTGTPAVEGIVLEKLESKEGQCHPEAFSKMFNLRLLKLHNVHLPKRLRCLPNSLRFLKWKGFPLNSLPLDFEPSNLVELNMCHSSIEQLWTGTKNFEKLKVIKLSHSKSLTKTPDFEGFQNLERLDLEGCESLVEIHFSVGVLKKLTFLNLKDCKSLELLPDEIEMECLEVLILSGCSRVKKISNFVDPMEHLRKLSLDGTAIESIPSSIEHLTSLSSLDLRDCINLNCLPSTIGKLQSLKFLNVSGCPKLAKMATSSKRKRGMGGTAEEWPSSFGLLGNLESFFFRGPKGLSQQSWYMSLLFQIFPMKSLQPMRPFLPPLSGLFSLKELDLSDGNLLEGAIPSDIGCLPSLVSLNLSGNNFLSLPTSIGQLSKLENLYLSRCKRLRHLPVLSSEVNLEVTADGCTSLELLQSPSNLNRVNSSGFNFINCFGMVGKESYNHVTCTMLQRYLKRVSYAAGDRYEIVIPGSEIPWWFPHQRMGSSTTVELTPHWRDTKWMGYALCAVFQVFGSGWDLSCVLEVNGKEDYPAPLLSTDVQPKSDHLWLFYVSRDISFGTEWQNSSCNQLIFSFKSSGSCLVKRCSARLVYEQDAEEFNQIVTQSSSNIDGEGPSGSGRLGSILASLANKFRIPHF